MKSCSKCSEVKDLDRFPMTDFGRSGSQCKDCLSKTALDNYYKRKSANGTALEPVVTLGETKIKCKDFFFYE